VPYYEHISKALRPTEEWPGGVDLSGWLYTEIKYKKPGVL